MKDKNLLGPLHICYVTDLLQISALRVYSVFGPVIRPIATIQGRCSD